MTHHSILFSFVSFTLHLSHSSSFFFFLMIRRPPRSTLSSSSAASDVYKRQQHMYLSSQGEGKPQHLRTIAHSISYTHHISRITHIYLYIISLLLSQMHRKHRVHTQHTTHNTYSHPQYPHFPSHTHTHTHTHNAKHNIIHHPTVYKTHTRFNSHQWKLVAYRTTSYRA
eukprot:TRINITY_DN12992_c0_g1_i1.p1 TRINITY_DN12992_c0_g1~~TRINITY_DN12992_c0_g1_i1.p1  ORF type:complete len:169 (+),score=4.88 TRINITY_DN12992_c0_g1_i1:46-552(+)